MAKTIKFNLICDGNPVRTIEDLQNNFSVEDILGYYHNKLLHRWLEVRGYEDELRKVSEIVAIDDMEVIKRLVEIFDVAADKNKVEESVYMLKYFKERQAYYSVYEKQAYEVENILGDHLAGYIRMVNEIICNPDNVALIKSNIEEIGTNYKRILTMNYRELFWYLYENKNTLAIMCLLMNEKTRVYYLPFMTPEVSDETAEEIFVDESYELGCSSKVCDSDKWDMYNKIIEIISNAEFETRVGENLMVYSGKTDGYWKDLEPKEKKFMIISIYSGDFVRSAGLMGGDMSYEDITNKFVIVDGIDYKSNSSSHKLCYMEV